MDEGEQQNNLPLVPFPSENTEVILRHGSSVVLYDPRSEQVTLASAQDVEPGVCPTCHRPYSYPEDDSQWTSQTFMSPDYFHLLHRSRTVSEASSRSTSPRRLLRSQESTPKRRPPSVVDADGEGESLACNISADTFSPGYFKKHFVEVKELGRGGNGVVLLVKHVLQGHEIGLLALKRIPVGDDAAWLAKVLKEVQLLQGLSHPNLVAYKHVWLEMFQPTAFTPSVPHAFILQQYCNRGDLQSYLFTEPDDSGGSLKWRRSKAFGASGRLRDQDQMARQLEPEQVFAFFKDIANGLHYLHRSGFIHRDLKPSNCLLHEAGGKLRCLVSDFGETTGEHVARRSTGGTGTVSYCAPEVLKRDANTGRLGNFTPKSDIFSLGLILYLMCFRRLPYSNANPFDETAEDINKLRDEIATWAGIDDDRRRQFDLPEVLSSSLSRLLSLEPGDRPSSQEVVQGLKSIGTKARATSHSSGDAAGWFGHDSKGAAGNRSPPSLSRKQSEKDRVPSQYKPPVVEGGDPRSPPQSPTDTIGKRLPSPVKTDLSVIRRRLSQKILSLPSPPNLPLLLSSSSPQSNGKWPLFSRGLVVMLIKYGIFFVKVWTTLAPCLPYAARPAAAYPLFMLAAIDLTGQGFWVSLGLATLHALAIAEALREGNLCQIRYDTIYESQM